MSRCGTVVGKFNGEHLLTLVCLRLVALLGMEQNHVSTFPASDEAFKATASSSSVCLVLKILAEVLTTLETRFNLIILTIKYR